MDPSNVLVLLKNGKSLIESLQKILKEELPTYEAIAGVHWTSAVQALESAGRSNDPKAELRIAVGHLRDAHNFWIRSIQKSKLLIATQRFLGGASGKEDKAFREAHCLSTLIAVTYRFLDDEQNYLHWCEAALQEFDSYARVRYDLASRTDEISVGSPAGAFYASRRDGESAGLRWQRNSIAGSLYGKVALKETLGMNVEEDLKLPPYVTNFGNLDLNDGREQIVKVVRTQGDTMICPRCKSQINLKDKGQWNGLCHRACGQGIVPF